MIVLTDAQSKAIEFFELESERYIRLAKHLKDIDMPLLAFGCQEFSKRLKGTLELQVRMLKNPQQYFGFTKER